MIKLGLCHTGLTFSQWRCCEFTNKGVNILKPSERIIGTYNLDDIKEYGSVFLPSKYDKSERRLHISIHAEGAIKVHPL